MPGVNSDELPLDAAVSGGLFEGIKFWLSQKVPQRTRFLNDVRANGGVILPIEKHADVKIVDHARKEQLPGTHSYTYIERSVRNGVLEDLSDHAVGPPEGVTRSVGSVVHPAKSTRTKFTAQDDSILVDWIKENPQKSGGSSGREIYIQLATKHPHHPWQAWRDRYIKYVGKNRQSASFPDNAPPTPPSDRPSVSFEARKPRHRCMSCVGASELFSEDDAEALMLHGDDILMVEPQSIKLAWQEWATRHDVDRRHSAKEWQCFWEHTVRRRYLKRQAKKARQAFGDGKKIKSESPSPISMKGRNFRGAIPTPSNPSQRDLSADVIRRSPSFRPEPAQRGTPEPMVFPGSLLVGAVRENSATVQESPTNDDSKRDHGQTEGIPGALKRKRTALNDEAMPSHPEIERLPSKRTSQDALSWSAREIASTPDRSPTQPLPTFAENYEVQSHKRILPELDPTREHTQAVFREPTPSIDFEVALPDDGWGEEVNDSGPDEGVSAPQPYDSLPDTQKILQNVTQLPDFSLPEPEGGWNLPSLPFESTSSHHAQGAESSDQAAPELDAWIAAYVTKGFECAKVHTVYKCCSINSELADKVLNSIGPYGKIPTDWKDVWTESDDSKLESTDARDILYLEGKHGRDRLDARFEFIRYYLGDQ